MASAPELHDEDAPTICVSANARPGVGGQGLNFEHMLRGIGAATKLVAFGKGPHPGYPSLVAPAAALPKMLDRVPVVRGRYRDWIVLADDVEFDLFVSRRLPRVKFVQGAVGQCALTLARARSSGARTLLDVVNAHVDDFAEATLRESRHFAAPSFMHPLMIRRIKQEYERADVIRVMSDVSRETFLRRGFSEARVVTVRPYFDLSEFSPASFAEPVFRVIFVGLIAPWKGFHYLVEGFLRAAIPNSELVFWGGSGIRRVTEYAGDVARKHPNIHFRAQEVRRVGLDEVYGRASVLVHPSLSDGFGLVVGEAMASGLPVVVTSCSGAADLVRDGQNGFVIPPRDPEAIAERLRWLAANQSQLREMGQRARQAVAECTFERFRDTYRDILKRFS